ncbi:putative HNHc nuclease [Liquorilactobacillus satsumensis]|uniref:putative HNHc nuclease n=1 Tax=Liquorilactobacillus satsumensis TaxID=259059 RepID=UPI00345E0302
MFGKLIKISNNKVEIELGEELDMYKLQKLANDKQPTVELSIQDGRQISPDQRKKIWALLNDMCDYTGDVPEEWEKRFKFKTHLDLGIKPFSLSDCSMTVANYMILEILDYLFTEDIPFKLKTWESIPDFFPKQLLCMKNRTCVICGRKNAQLAHFKAVGMGRNRRTIDERKMYFMSLCVFCHQEQHRIGINSFMSKYHIRPIRLNDEDLIRFNIMSKKGLDKFEKRDLEIN